MEVKGHTIEFNQPENAAKSNNWKCVKPPSMAMHPHPPSLISCASLYHLSHSLIPSFAVQKNPQQSVEWRNLQ